MTHIVPIDQINRAVLSPADSQVRVWPALIRQQEHAARSKIEIVDRHRCLVMGREVVGWGAVRVDGLERVAVVAPSTAGIESTVSGHEVDSPRLVGGQSVAALPD